MLERAVALHFANRLGLGPKPGQIEQIVRTGAEPYLDEQLAASALQVPASLRAMLDTIPAFGKNTFQLYRDYWWKLRAHKTSDGRLPKFQKKLLKIITSEVAPQARMARMIRAIGSPYQLQEALVDFWFNHFNVYGRKNLARIWVGAYEEEAIRPHTLGKFSDLLLATAKHPAMLVYLDNWRNVAPGTGRVRRKGNGINENYSREVMELHTMGVDGGYTQSDVTALAHILTGWTVGIDNDVEGTAKDIDDWRQIRGGFGFVAEHHDGSPQVFLGRRFAGGGVEDGEAALLMLAHHPSTARHVSFKLAQYFVADQPPARVVDEMAREFKRTGGDLRAVLRSMVTSKEFGDPENFGRKFKTPFKYVVSMARAAGMDPLKSAPLAEELKELGQPIYGCVTPDGYACTESAWLDPDSMMRRLALAVRFGSGAYMQDYLASTGYGKMSRRIKLQPQVGGARPLDAERLLATLGLELSAKTKAAVATTEKSARAGVILGSPEFMRC